MFRLVLGLLISVLTINGALAQIKAAFVDGSKIDLENPHDLKLSADGRFLFVSDVGNNRVAILDPDSLDLIASFGADHQSGTHDVDVDAEGRLYVADTHNHRVGIYEFNGSDAKLIGELTGNINKPEGVLVHPNGRIYVGAAGSDNVVVYEDGNAVGELTGLSQPHDLELSPNGDIWLADSGNDRMLLLSPDLEIKRELGGSPYDFNGVRYQDVLSDGTLITADKNNHQVKIIGADGSVLSVLGDGSPDLGPGKFRTPEGIEVKDDILWISDSGNDRVVKYRLTKQ